MAKRGNPTAWERLLLAGAGPGRGSLEPEFPTVVRVGGTYMKLMDMTREDLLIAAAEYEQRGNDPLAGHQDAADTEGE